MYWNINLSCELQCRSKDSIWYLSSKWNGFSPCDYKWPNVFLWYYWITTLQWRHDEHNGVSNHRLLDFLFNRLFGRRSKITWKPRVADLCEGNSPVTGDSPHKEPVTRKMLLVDDVIMMCHESNLWVIDMRLRTNFATQNRVVTWRSGDRTVSKETYCVAYNLKSLANHVLAAAAAVAVFWQQICGNFFPDSPHALNRSALHATTLRWP